ncbi:unnamed protein product [Parnassius apollo]|uniref:(apollo) hypothetical protein n=1 Tax=Parnassius apollo TaxID=110799 RepID=A0A8S3WM50_PARAO|nr:unnamed protein product [Parnassius apollo]
MLEVQLDEDILVLLSDGPKTETPMGPAIHKDTANRWQDILEKGVKESLLKNYLIFSEYDLLMAPPLNSGVKAADRDFYKTRLLFKQKQLGVTIAALGAVANIISEETHCRILCDTHFMKSRTRRGFIILSINTYPLYFQYNQQHRPFKLPKPTSQGTQQIAAANLQHKARAAVNAAPAGRTSAGSQHFTPPADNQADDVSPDVDEVPFSGQYQYFASK